MSHVVRLSIALVSVLLLILVSAGAAAAFNPPDQSPGDVCWERLGFPGGGAIAPAANGNTKAWNGHFNGLAVENPCS